MAKKVQKKTQEQKYPFFYLLPIIMIIAVIPAIVYMYAYDTGLGQFDWYQGPIQTLDFFLHSKMVWLIITFILILFLLLFMIFSAEINPIWTKNLIPLAVYCALTLISAFCSINKSYSFSGIYEQFEPVWILLGYGLIVYYSFYNLHSEKAVKGLMPWFVAGVCLMAVLGLLQTFSHDFFRTDFAKNFIMPEVYRKQDLTFKFEEGRAYLTLYNPNYVGFYVALVVPVLVALLFHTKKVLYRIGYGILTIAMLLILFASQSRAGIIALAVSFVIMLLCMRNVFFKNWKITITALVAIVAVFIGINLMNHGILIDRMKTMFSAETETYALENIVTDDDVTITYKGNTVHFEMPKDSDSEEAIVVTDDAGNVVAHTADASKQTYAITDNRFPFTYGIVAASSENSFNGFQVTIDDKTWYFTNTMKTNDSKYYVKALGNSLFRLKEQKRGDGFLDKHYHFANMRGYIWAQTIPLLKKYFFVGSGPDTFTIAFPNDDLVGMYNSGHDGEIITRPHCMYLQIAVQTGVLSLIAFLTFFGWYIISSLKLYWKADYSEFLPKIGIAILASVIGYLILGLTNDSCITVSPIFFALAGMGLGINYHLKKEAPQTK
ncbi:MAG: O-antigen ligase family protein [Butyribacter sp.]|nr:O-antigen ligase family protein [bacterium]MDY3853690.1 O-antigen ligase family protein [Butyribacter sp.]